MTFPVMIPIGPISLHPHVVFEALAYFIGFRVYLWTRDKGAYDGIQSLWLVIGAAAGAALGSKLLYWLESPALTIERWNDLVYLMEGKTIVGGLLGGLVGVETTKRLIGIAERTGDNFVFPLILGMAIGRIGCFLSGLEDHTHGIATTWFVGVDFGDGVTRHPTQLYEFGFLLALAAALAAWKRTAGEALPKGRLFQWFMLSYLSFRFGVDFIKPTPHPYFGFNNIQLAALAGMVYYARLIVVSAAVPKPQSVQRSVPGAER
ncbi:prolipoprotein diacylglyceryl transferase [Paenibacillus sp. TRM 82003]|nr:prolipoprotein diacylglyceryl transferase [Paenibacillus sp. TRM 82003]